MININLYNINTERILKMLHMVDINSNARYDILNIALISINLKNDVYFPPKTFGAGGNVQERELGALCLIPC